MLTEKNISDKYKYCEFCGRTLPKHYEGTLCPTCQEAQLFRNVRDYIRANTVNEYEVAEPFSYACVLLRITFCLYLNSTASRYLSSGSNLISSVSPSFFRTIS